MNDTDSRRQALAGRINAIEEAYEFMLAYAAQGRQDGGEMSDGHGIRGFLESLDAAIDGLGAALTAFVGEDEASGPGARFMAFLEVIDGDARRAGAGVGLVLAQSSISSQLVDNLNASIHLRALLTDLFLIDEIIKAGNRPA